MAFKEEVYGRSIIHYNLAWTTKWKKELIIHVAEKLSISADFISSVDNVC